MTETQRKRAFAYHYYRGQEPAQAAKLAGWPPEEGVRLLRDAVVRRQLSQLRQAAQDPSDPQESARRGLERIIFCDNRGAVRLLEGEEEAEADLAGVAEFKRPKGGGLEVRFYDKLKAIQMLQEMTPAADNAANALLEALSRGEAEDD